MVEDKITVVDKETGDAYIKLNNKFSIVISSIDRTKFDSKNYLAETINKLIKSSYPHTRTHLIDVVISNSDTDYTQKLPWRHQIEIHGPKGKLDEEIVHEKHAAALNMARCLKTSTNPNAEYLLVLEDDLDFTEDWWLHMLRMVNEMEDDEILSLYCNPTAERHIEDKGQYHPQPPPGVVETASTIGEAVKIIPTKIDYPLWKDSTYFYGNQALVIPLKVIDKIYEEFYNVCCIVGPSWGAYDEGIRLACDRLNIKLSVAHPSLVQHVGEVSTGLNDNLKVEGEDVTQHQSKFFRKSYNVPPTDFKSEEAAEGHLGPWVRVERVDGTTYIARNR